MSWSRLWGPRLLALAGAIPSLTCGALLGLDTYSQGQAGHSQGGAAGAGGDGGGGAIELRPRGAPCDVPNECDSGHCSDGLCCSSVCDQPCDACNVSGLQGECVVVADGLPPVTDCGPYVCDGRNTTCPVNCAIDQDCIADHYCTPSLTCTPQKTQGEACVGVTECLAPWVCATGVCCESDCMSICHSCRSVDTGANDGVCAVVQPGLADPHGSCSACDGFGNCS